jgi:endonuclease/exonuclease/phosphatase (EEP) superfamily protein YafD
VKRGVLFKFGLWIVSAIFADTLSAQQTPSPIPAQGAFAFPSSAAKSITTAYWNIQWFPGGRPNATRGEESRQIASVHRDMAQLNTDLLGMEEVRDFDYATVAVQPFRGFKVDVCSNFPPREDQNRPQQVAIASRLQPMSAWAEAWKSGSAVTPPRGFAFAAYQIAPKHMLLVYAVHLKSNRGALPENMAIREESIHQLRAHMRAMTDAYGKFGALTWIVGGDFNTAPDKPRFASEKTIRVLFADGFQWNWQNVPATQRITLPPDNRYPAACFDHIFYRGAKLRRAWVASTSPRSSDHRAIAAVFEL